MIRLTNVCKDYETKAGPRRVLDRINLTIHPGQRVGILGRNGAGKSTLVRLISGAEQPTLVTIERNIIAHDVTFHVPRPYSRVVFSALTAYLPMTP